MELSNHACLNCGKEIKSGRADKKFCDVGCKNDYYNKIKIREHQEIKRVALILNRNRRILKKLFDPVKETITEEQKLLKLGFDFDYHTHFVVTKHAKNEFTFCFDYGYRKLENGSYKIIEAFNK